MERTLISVEMVKGVRYIHYLGYGYCAGNPEDKPYRWVEYVFLSARLDDILKFGIDKWEMANQEFVHQYIYDLNQEEYADIKEYTEISCNDVSSDMPCGTYYLVY